MTTLHRNQYTQQSYDLLPVVMSGIWAEPKTINVKVTYIGSLKTLTFPSFIAAETTASFISFQLPDSNLYPNEDLLFTLIAIDGGVNGASTGTCLINQDGSCQISMESNLYTGSGDGGFHGFSVTYDSNPF